MIEIEILESPDDENLGTKKFFKNSVVFGSTNGDVLLRDPEVINFHFSFEINENQVFPLLNRKIKYFRLNSKKVNGEFPLKPGDIIGIGTTEIKLVNFEPEGPSQYINIYKNNLKDMVERNDPFIDKMKEYQKLIEE